LDHASFRYFHFVLTTMVDHFHEMTMMTTVATVHLQLTYPDHHQT
jgi:hypothetical protein